MAVRTQAAENTVEPGTHEDRKAGVTPSGPKGDNPATAGPGPTKVKSGTPENARGHINPSPEDANVTPETAPEK
ncbi:MAG: hypothetical protein PW789_10320 [Edaphobacter sp.]|uniref:hypothetical protein n=1 Tax=Edaphobacter sp. TaxID=1934404 RepID=UPI00239CF8F9|nr:hypothetical protein [Edaphobacter sp.]MDE1176986.1 hypothetical protein [Edaphobacter sp.]